MPIITLPDGSERQFDQPLTGLELVNHIGPGLAKAALAIKINNELKDLSFLLKENCSVTILTAKDPEGIDILRHTLTAQVLARAIKDLYPTSKLAIGPTIEHGFYYDIDLEESLTPEDLPKIETRMREIIKENLSIERIMVQREEAIQYFKTREEFYKVEIIANAPKENREISLYRQGNNGQDIFTDLCYGPHLPNTGKIGTSFKLMSLAGAYWRGDSNNKMLTRIYGVAFANDKELKAHLHYLEEASKRDHRKIGKALDLFHLQEEAPGMIFWHANGWTIWQIIEQYMRKQQIDRGYLEIKTPIVVDRTLWEKSGHWENYRENMFTTASESRDYAVKPMNCPCHIQVFNNGLHSYRDLPMRLAEFGSCHRNEPSGSLHGIMRVRGFVQDDAHIFCRDDQILSEVENFHLFAMETYRHFGFTDVSVKLSLRPEKRAGDEHIWNLAESSLRTALSSAGISWEELPGEGAFYGPKVEYHIKDAIGRSWQVGTIQLDFVLPKRLGAEFVDEDNVRKEPVLLHRAILGSFERFIGILIEHHAGSFPVWLAPIQVCLINITSNQEPYIQSVAAKLKELGVRVKMDLRNEKVGYKIREATIARIPYMLVAGDREVENQMIAVRTREGEDLSTMTIDAFYEFMKNNKN